MKNLDKLLEEKQGIMKGICNAVNSNDNAALLENMTKFQNLVQEQRTAAAHSPNQNRNRRTTQNRLLTEQIL